MKLSALVLIAFLVQACQPTSPSTSLNAESADLETTIVSLERAQSLFDDMASRPEIPFKYTASGCQYRSHRMGWLLEQEGVISTQVYVYGGLKDPATGFGWQYHVAPMVLVSSNDGPHPMVIDPSTALGPLSPEDWVALFSEKPLAQLLVHYTSPMLVSRARVGPLISRVVT
jgi:hypothetical protein